MKFARWFGENIPLIICFGLAFVASVTQDYEYMHFYIILGILFIILRELSEVKAIVKKILNEVKRTQ